MSDEVTLRRLPACQSSISEPSRGGKWRTRHHRLRQEDVSPIRCHRRHVLLVFHFGWGTDTARLCWSFTFGWGTETATLCWSFTFGWGTETATLCWDVACLPSSCLDLNVNSLSPAGSLGVTMTNSPD